MQTLIQIKICINWLDFFSKALAFPVFRSSRTLGNEHDLVKKFRCGFMNPILGISA